MSSFILSRGSMFVSFHTTKLSEIPIFIHDCSKLTDYHNLNNIRCRWFLSLSLSLILLLPLLPCTYVRTKEKNTHTLAYTKKTADRLADYQ